MGIFSGILFIVIGFVVISSAKVDSDWVHVNGQVTGAEAREGTVSGDATGFAAIISYEVAGTVHTITSNSYFSSPPQKGELRQVAYDPLAPHESELVVDGVDALLPWMFPFTGALAILMALISLGRLVKELKD